LGYNYKINFINKMNNKEDQEALELIKEFLKTNGYKGTLECLEKEDSYKNITEKKTKVNLFVIIKNLY